MRTTRRPDPRRARSACGRCSPCIYLFVPIFVIVLFSFNDNQGRFNFTWQGFTLKHWQDPFKIEQLQEAFVNSLTVAALTTLIAVALGTFVALALVRYRWRGRGAVERPRVPAARDARGRARRRAARAGS